MRVPTPLTERQRQRGDEIAKLVASRISTVRTEKGLSQHALGKRSGLSRPSIVNIEVGRQEVPLRTLARIADGLGVSVKELLG